MLSQSLGRLLSLPFQQPALFSLCLLAGYFVWRFLFVENFPAEEEEDAPREEAEPISPEARLRALEREQTRLLRAAAEGKSSDEAKEEALEDAPLSPAEKLRALEKEQEALLRGAEEPSEEEKEKPLSDAEKLRVLEREQERLLRASAGENPAEESPDDAPAEEEAPALASPQKAVRRGGAPVPQVMPVWVALVLIVGVYGILIIVGEFYQRSWDRRVWAGGQPASALALEVREEGWTFLFRKYYLSVQFPTKEGEFVEGEREVSQPLYRKWKSVLERKTLPVFANISGRASAAIAESRAKALNSRSQSTGEGAFQNPGAGVPSSSLPVKYWESNPSRFVLEKPGQTSSALSGLTVIFLLAGVVWFSWKLRSASGRRRRTQSA